MHIVIALFAIIVVVYRGVWKDWKKYHATMLFSGMMELVYNSIAKENNYFLWKLKPDLFLNRISLIGLYVVIIFPATALLFLSKWPREINKQVIHIVKWVGIYTIIEAVGSMTNSIVYINKWGIGHSLIFNIILFIGLIIHHKKPVIAYIMFLLVTIAGIWAFKIPIYSS